MVSQVICVICAIVPEPHTTEITFYKFPKATETLFKAWKSVLVKELANERPEFSDDDYLNETYVCSQHFTASDFSFDNGKLILLKDAIPSRITKNLDDAGNSNEAKEYEPSSLTCNFASTLTKDFVTTSHHNLRSDLICTETSRALTVPSVSEFAMFQSPKVGNKTVAKYTIDNITKDTNDSLNVKKRDAFLEQKIVSYGKIFKRLRSDNLLTASYVDELKAQLPEAEELLEEVMKNE